MDERNSNGKTPELDVNRNRNTKPARKPRR
jgi:hypothetical protein